MSEDIRHHAGSKYLRPIHSATLDEGEVLADVYEVIEGFGVTCPALQHALKKLLCSGLRGKGSKLDDLREAAMSVSRAIQLQERRERKAKRTKGK